MFRPPKTPRAHSLNPPVVITNEQLRFIQLCTVYYMLAVCDNKGRDFLYEFIGKLFLPCGGSVDELQKVSEVPLCSNMNSPAARKSKSGWTGSCLWSDIFGWR